MLVMDDNLQWADVGSLELPIALLDPLSHDLAIVRICRSNEVALCHDFAAIFQCLEDEQGTHITNIGFGSLTLEAINLLVAGILCISKEKCKYSLRMLHAM
jgi:predicted ATPase